MRQMILQGMEAMGFSVTTLGDKISINRGTLSGLLKGDRPFNVNQLDSITAVLGKEEGWLYDMYIEESYRDGAKLSRPRLEPFLLRCAQIKREDCLEKVFRILSENGDSFLSIMYDIANFLQLESYAEGEKMLYKHILRYDSDYNSERFLYAHYRLFVLSLGSGDASDIKALIKFEPFLNRLPDSVQLDAVFHIIQLYYFQGKWVEAEHYGHMLISISKRVCQVRLNTKVRIEEHVNKYPLVFYHGYGYVTRSSCLQKMKRYNEALILVDNYADLSEYPVIEENFEHEINRLQLWSVGNRRTLNLLLGKKEYLADYIQFIKDNDDELLTGLTNLSEAANEHNFEIIPVLKELELKALKTELKHNVDRTHFYMSMYNLSNYYINRGMYKDGLNSAICGLAVAVQLNNNDFFRQVVTLFEINRNNASQEQKEAYLIAMTMKGGEQNEKIDPRTLIDGSFMRNSSIGN